MALARQNCQNRKNVITLTSLFPSTKQWTTGAHPLAFAFSGSDLSTHPATDERIARLRTHARR
jgi:hypothetical protein